MHEERLSPELGRLIDEAKSAVRSLGAGASAAEGVALLAADGAIHGGAAACAAGPANVSDPSDPARAPVSAAEMALERAQKAGDEEILAAAVARPDDPAETVVPSPESYRCLAALDPDLPVILKQRGRWVVLPVSQVRPVC